MICYLLPLLDRCKEEGKKGKRRGVRGKGEWDEGKGQEGRNREEERIGEGSREWKKAGEED